MSFFGLGGASRREADLKAPGDDLLFFSLRTAPDSLYHESMGTSGREILRF